MLDGFPAAEDWDDLVVRSHEESLFLRSEFLSAAWETLDEKTPLGLVRATDAHGEMIGAGLFKKGRSGAWAFLGTGPGDYLDLLTDRRLPAAASGELKARMIGEFFRATGSYALQMPRLVDHLGTLAGLASHSKLFLTKIRTMPAPSMQIAPEGANVDRSSFRRAENRLARQGKVSVAEWTRAEEIVPKLGAFFEQFRRRWKGTPCEHIFDRPEQKAFYERLTERMDRTDWLRYMEVHLDSELIAAHFGFRYKDRLLWYKPTFNVDYAKLSPGVVLLHRLAASAKEQGLAELDFTIGGEAFKSRYATIERTVTDAYVTQSWLPAARMRAEMRARHFARSVLTKLGWPKPSDHC